jgi:hypothetical protein
MGFMDPGVAEKIAGHAWPLREAEFQDAFGEEFEQGDLQNLIQGVLAGEFDKTQEGPNGQTAYWDQDNGLIVIYNPNDEEQGTAFLPDDPADYWYEHLWQD